MDLGTGTELYVDGNVSGWEVLDIRPPGDTRPAEDPTNMGTQTAREKLPARLLDIGELEMDIALDPESSLLAQLINVPVHHFRLVFPDQTTESFYGFLTGYQPDVPLEKVMAATVKIQVNNHDRPTVGIDGEGGGCNNCGALLESQYWGLFFLVMHDTGEQGSVLDQTSFIPFIGRFDWSMACTWTFTSFVDYGLAVSNGQLFYDPLDGQYPWKAFFALHTQNMLDSNGNAIYLETQFRGAGGPCVIPQLLEGNVGSDFLGSLDALSMTSGEWMEDMFHLDWARWTNGDQFFEANENPDCFGLLYPLIKYIMKIQLTASIFGPEPTHGGVIHLDAFKTGPKSICTDAVVQEGSPVSEFSMVTEVDSVGNLQFTGHLDLVRDYGVDRLHLLPFPNIQETFPSLGDWMSFSQDSQGHVQLNEPDSLHETRWLQGDSAAYPEAEPLPFIVALIFGCEDAPNSLAEINDISVILTDANGSSWTHDVGQISVWIGEDNPGTQAAVLFSSMTMPVGVRPRITITQTGSNKWFLVLGMCRPATIVEYAMDSMAFGFTVDWAEAIGNGAPVLDRDAYKNTIVFIDSMMEQSGDQS